MGSRGKVRISKKSSSSSTSRSHDKKKSRNLFKVLNPYKVYITDPSNFKSLVQEHTGNGICSPPTNPIPIPISSPSTISSITSEPIDDQQFQILQNNSGNITDQDYYLYGFQESSPEWSFDGSCSDMVNVPFSTFGTCDDSEGLNMSTQNFNNIDMIHQAHSRLDMGNVPLSTFGTWDDSEELNMSTQNLSNIEMINQAHSLLGTDEYQMSFPQYGDEVENSWISEMNIPFGYNYDGCGALPEIFEYAYDLSGIM